jgi:hypothetical protein
MNPVENAEGVDIRRVPLIRQLEPGATQWQRISGRTRLGGCSGILIIARARPLIGPGPGIYGEQRADPRCGADEPERREAAARPTWCGSMNLT